MSALEALEQRVQQELANQHSNILALVINNRIRKHNDPNCGCEYCKCLPKYINAKIKLTQLKRLMYSDWMDMCDEYQTWKDLEDYKGIVKYLKKKKDALKTPI